MEILPSVELTIFMTVITPYPFYIFNFSLY